MAQITVSNYLQLIDELIDESRLAEAVAHSRHLLEQHPRHVDTYRSLGKALLEQGDYAGAVDIFQRVLSALPADFVAHAGLAIIHKAGDRWKQALWHMERAFEVEPYNGAIRAELQDLYGRRDGLAPAQVELTRGALARLYVKGGLYQQAILELRELLAAEPDRVDLQLLLAEAHWRAEERVEAAEQCEAILELLPDCIDAHTMLADIMLATGDAGSAMPHLERLQALTQLSQRSVRDRPALADLFSLPGAPALPRDVHADRLSDAEALGIHQQQETAAWISELDLEAEGVEDDLGWLNELQEEGGGGEAGATAPAEDVPDWLAAAAATVREQPDEAQPEPPAAPQEEAAGGSAGWVESLAEEEFGWPEAPEEPVEAPDWMAADEGFDWLEQPAETGSPDWLADVEPAGDPDSGQEEAGPVAEDEIADESNAGEEAGKADEQEALAEWGEPQDWEFEADREGLVMDERGNEQDEQPEAHDGEEAAADLDWLQQLGQPEPTSEPGAKGPEADAGEPGELPDWLGGEGDLGWLDDEPDAEPELPASEGPAADDLSWLDQIAGGQAEPPGEMPTLEWPDDDEPDAPEEPEPDAPMEGGDAPGLDWLDALGSEGDVVTAAWLDELAEEAEIAGADDEGDELPLFSDDIADLDWLEEGVAQPDAGAEPGDEALNWLAGAVAGEAGMDWLTGAEPDEGTPDTPAEPLDEEAEAVAADVFAAEETDEPVLDYLEAAPDDAPDAPEELEEAMAWLDDFPNQGEGDETDDVPEDLDEAMAWLEQLAAKQGAPLEELPSVTAGVAAVADDAGEPEEAPEEAAIFGELPELDLPEEETPEPHLEWMAALAEEPEEPAAAAPAGDEFDEPAELDEAMAWLEGLAEQDEPDALPDWLQDDEADLGDFAEDERDATALAGDEPELEMDDDAMAGVPEDLDEALAWLEQLAAQQGAPAEELPSLQVSDAPAEEPADWPAETEEEPAPAMEITPEMETPPAQQVPDVAMMYLDSLLVGGWQQAGTGAPDLADELPDDPESALAWLEQLATGPAAQPPVEEAEDDDEWAWTEELPEPEQWEEAEPEAALSPDETIAEETEAAAGEWAWTEQLPEPEQWEEAEPALEEAVVELPAGETDDEAFDEIPEDPDEAMAWLERLAARQGAPLDELPSVDEVSDEVDTPDWLAREMAAAEPPESEMPDAALDSGEIDWLEGGETPDWLDELAADEAELPEIEESVPDVAPEELAQMEASFDLDILKGEEMEPALPDWLAGDDESWPAELTDIDSWLAAEEEASRVDMPIPEPARPAPPAPEPAPRPEPAPAERIPAPEGSNAGRLEAARAALDAGDVDGAIAAYHDFMGGGSGLNVVIADLEMETAANEQPMLLRLLGDAYMENGQLNRALDAYRRALDLL